MNREQIEELIDDATNKLIGSTVMNYRANGDGTYRIWIDEHYCRTDIISNASDAGYDATEDQIEGTIDLLMSEAAEAGLIDDSAESGT